MRIVSSEGQFDVPYNEVLVWYKIGMDPEDPVIICASPISDINNDIELASYSSKYKAVSELNRLRDTAIKGAPMFRFKRDEEI